MLSDADRKALSKGIAPSRAYIDEKQIKLLERVAVVLKALAPQVKELNRRVALKRLSREFDGLEQELREATAAQFKEAQEAARFSALKQPPGGH